MDFFFVARAEERVLGNKESSRLTFSSSFACCTYDWMERGTFFIYFVCVFSSEKNENHFKWVQLFEQSILLAQTHNTWARL